MHFANNYLAGVEAIGFQTSKEFFKELTEAIRILRLEPVTNDSQGLKTIAKVISDHTDIKLIVGLNSNNSVNARIQTPKIDKNHPLLMGDFRRDDNTHGMLAYKHLQNKTGWVDLKQSRVHGMYAKIAFHLFIYKGLLAPEIPDEEVAALLLHELGHVFYYFVYLGAVVSANYALTTAAEAMVKAPTKTAKVTIINDVNIGFDLKLDVDDVVEGTNAEAVQINLADAYMKQQRSVLGTNIYDTTGWEFLADQFAIRHGAGLHLVRIMDRASKTSDHNSYMTNATFLAIEALKVAAAVGAHIASGGLSTTFFIIIGVCYHPFSSHYDTTRDRTTRARQQLTAALKDNTLTKEQRESYVKDIEAIIAIEETIANRRTLFTWLATTLVPSYRRQWNQKVIQQRMEELAFNKLFVTSAKLKNLI